MNENEKNIKLSPETEEIINSKTQDNAIKEIERIEKLQKDFEKEKEQWRNQMSEAADKYANLGKEVSTARDELAQERKDTKALREALVAQKQKYSTLTEPEERLSYGEMISKKAYELIKKRCKMGYYGGTPCRECKIELATK